MEYNFKSYFLYWMQYLQASRFLVCSFSTLNIKCNIYKTNYDAYYQEWPMFLVNSLFVKFQSLFQWVFSLTRKWISLMIDLRILSSAKHLRGKLISPSNQLHGFRNFWGMGGTIMWGERRALSRSETKRLDYYQEVKTPSKWSEKAATTTLFVQIVFNKNFQWPL